MKKYFRFVLILALLQTISCTESSQKFCHSRHTYLRMLTPQHPTSGPAGDAIGRLSPKFPEGDISFVMNIPPIGTKFQDPETMGPHSNQENYFGNDDDPMVIELTFRF